MNKSKFEPKVTLIEGVVGFHTRNIHQEGPFSQRDLLLVCDGEVNQMVVDNLEDVGVIVIG